ncbi:hypothetical protein [Actinospica robiniae]|uniref:hypothetical protein n=1 Tax=Actinospica robiniae TaxID=304901 RepID=UPI0003F81E47|nr:hypothetical protein [Actinospica robiniae]
MRSALIRAPRAALLAPVAAAAGLLVVSLPGTALAGSVAPAASASSPGQGIGPSPANGQLSDHCSVEQSAVQPGGELDFSLTVSQNTADPYQLVMGAIVTIYKTDDAAPSAFPGKANTLRMRNPANGSWLSAEEINGNVYVFDASGSSPWPTLPPHGSVTFEFRLTVAAGQSAGGYTIVPNSGGLYTNYFIWAKPDYSPQQCGFRIGSSSGHSGGSGSGGSSGGGSGSANGTVTHTAKAHTAASTAPSRTPSPTPSPSAAASSPAGPSSPPSAAAVPTHTYQHPQLASVADVHTAGAGTGATSGALAASAAATLACIALAGARLAGRRRPRGKR